VAEQQKKKATSNTDSCSSRRLFLFRKTYRNAIIKINYDYQSE